jgi:hypothetical protein
MLACNFTRPAFWPPSDFVPYGRLDNTNMTAHYVHPSASLINIISGKLFSQKEITQQYMYHLGVGGRPKRLRSTVPNVPFLRTVLETRSSNSSSAPYLFLPLDRVPSPATLKGLSNSLAQPSRDRRSVSREYRDVARVATERIWQAPLSLNPLLRTLNFPALLYSISRSGTYPLFIHRRHALYNGEPGHCFKSSIDSDTGRTQSAAG